MLRALPVFPLPAPPSDGNLGHLLPSQVPDHPPPTTVATHTRTIGVIHPPLDIRKIVDRFAKFVAKNPEYEKIIIAQFVNNHKFNFLKGSGPYYAYYQHRFRPVRRFLEPPEPEQYTVRLPEGITGEELDIIKLTAQFVAQNGNSFLTGLASREINNPRKILEPSDGLIENLSKSVADTTTVLERCLHRLEWETSQEQARQKAEDEIEQERMQMAMVDWHDFVEVDTIEFVDNEDEDLPHPMTLEEVIKRSKVIAMAVEEEVFDHGMDVDMVMDEEEVQLVEEGMREATFDEKKWETKARTLEELEPPMKIMQNWKRPEERTPAERDPEKSVVSPISGELIPINEMAEHMRISLIDPKYKEQKQRMMAKIQKTNLAHDDEIARNIVGLAQTRPDIFGTTEEEISIAVKEEIEKKKEEQPKQVIWGGHTGSIGRKSNRSLSQSLSGEDQTDAGNNEARALPGPAAPPPKPGVPSVRPLSPPPGLALNIPHTAPNTVQYPALTSELFETPPRPRSVMPLISSVRPPPVPMNSVLHSLMLNQPPPHPHSVSVNPSSIPVPLPPGSQFTPLGMPWSFTNLPIPIASMSMMPPPPLTQRIPPPPPPKEAPPPLLGEPEPKRQKVGDSLRIPEDQFLAQHPGPVHVTVSVPNVDEGNLKGQLLEITVQSLSETIGSLKERIAEELQLPAKKQKLSGQAGFLKDNLSLAYYNIGAGESLTLGLRERGGRKK
ncbi:SWAP/Surp [Macleaya cordata]|uniref:SWAP/Surp n=1 Tax=Macleaya cordata TaxID=56857 RepID=A0A200QNR2_MACCD|nr:SWAP/Surp [Macleaya cordata]